MNKLNIFTKGLIKENPNLVLLLGMCPSLGVTSSAINGIGMGLATTAVLIMSAVLISLLRNFIPAKIRIPVFIVCIATVTTIVQLVMNAYLPTLYDALGIFLPLIVVNCIVFARAEVFARKNNPFLSLLDGLGMGLGFTLSLFLIGICREALGDFAVLGHKFTERAGLLMFVLAPGAFIVMSYLVALFKRISE